MEDLEAKLAEKLDGRGSSKAPSRAPSTIVGSEKEFDLEDHGPEHGPDHGPSESSKPSRGFPMHTPVTPGNVDERDFLDSKTKTMNSLLSRSEHPGYFAVDDVGKSRLPSSKTKEFHSLEDAVDFPKHFVEQLLSERGTGEEVRTTLNDLVHYLEDASHSSSFSGVGAPETALMLFHREVQRLLPDRKVLWPNYMFPFNPIF